MPEDLGIPVEPGGQPILCSPYEEPNEHWLYTRDRPRPERIASRRDASYWFKSVRAGSAQRLLLPDEDVDDLPLVNALRYDVRRWRNSGWQNASETTKRLLRHWSRKDRPRRLFFCQLEAVETVLYLEEILRAGKRPRWKPRLAPEEFRTLCHGKNPRPEDWVAKVAQHPKLADVPHDTALSAIPRYACKMATGSGKTVVMAMLIAWAFCNRGSKPADPRYPRRVLVLCPNLTIRERLVVLRPDAAGNYYEEFDLVPAPMRPELAKGKVLVANWHLLNRESPEIRVGTAKVGDLGEETPEAFARARLGDLWDDEPLMVLNDEGHHAYRPAAVTAKLTEEEKREREAATVWVEGLDRINAACGIGLAVDLSATPFYIQGSGYPEGSPLPWIVSDFSLVDAIESGITKIPRLPARDDSGRPDPKYFRLWQRVQEALGPGDRLPGGRPKPEAAYREAEDALLTLAGQWRERFRQVQDAAPGEDRTPPVMIVVCDNTDIASHFHRLISGETLVAAEESGNGVLEPEWQKRKSGVKPKKVKRYGDGLNGFEEFWNAPGAEVTLRIDSKLLDEAESGQVKEGRKQVAERLRQTVSTVGKPGKAGGRVRCVVSVNMLSEGWDANNVTQILGLRAFHSQLLCEQVVGRGLRRMDYTPDPETGLLTPEYVDVFGIPFSLIPFKGRPPGEPQKEDRPKHEVMALPERRHLEIRFPVVEGYVTAPARNRVVCEVSEVEATVLNPAAAPTTTAVRPEVGYKVGHQSEYGGFDVQDVDRTPYYGSVHPQTVAFKIAAGVVRELSVGWTGGNGSRCRVSRQALFPQVLQIVLDYLRDRVDLNGMAPEEVGLDIYRQRIVGLLSDAIRPDDAVGEPPELPRLNRYRPSGSTASVYFKTVKPVVAATASHVNFVACDTERWEQAAAGQLEQLARAGLVSSFVRNERLEFVIPYSFQGNERGYEPDFIVSLENGVRLIVEIKGMEPPETPAKHEAAKRWVRAVNRWRQMGEWDFLVCRNPAQLGAQITERVAERKKRVQAIAARR
ncbi:MAG: hypothetical protein F4087_05905 [Gemmatimonadetes bacterium]|nr:hypothetical protein [Acidobacteriota bacterium]MYE68905.1 hypothetical protein [Gemmatimonadota bacterium]MYJ68031.1 hypothetical protein [Gemmatimonadota bacterium]